MTLRKVASCTVGMLLTAGPFAVPALAHHSFGLFDRTRTVEIQGTVRQFEWTNPHVYLSVEVPKPGGSTLYRIECASINLMSHQGWKVNSVKTGDRVKVALSPLRTGEPGGLLLRATLPNGATLQD